jgi:hypothetical protein
MKAVLSTLLSAVFMPELKPANQPHGPQACCALQVIVPDAPAPPPPVLPVFVSGARIVPRTIIVEPSPPPPPAFFLKQVSSCGPVSSHLGGSVRAQTTDTRWVVPRLALLVCSVLLLLHAAGACVAHWCGEMLTPSGASLQKVLEPVAQKTVLPWFVADPIVTEAPVPVPASSAAAGAAAADGASSTTAAATGDGAASSGAASSGNSTTTGVAASGK